MAKFCECPFCGSKSISAEISYEEKNFRIYCDECPAEMILCFVDAGLNGGEVIGFGEMQAVIQEMIDNWNTRTPKEQ